MPEAFSAASFVDSIGVCTHLAYTNTAYANTVQAVQYLGSLGIKHIRDGTGDYGPVANSINYGRWRQVYAAGISILDVVDPRGGWPAVSAEEMLEVINSYIDPAIGSGQFMFEGPNEYDLSGVAGWTSTLTAYQNTLYSAVNGKYPVVGPSMGRPPNSDKVGDISHSLDYGNIHAYYAGGAPGTTMQAYMLIYAQAMSGTKRLFVTETGYHNALHDHSNQPGVDEITSAKYLLRTLLLNYIAGIVRTYIYELLDEFPDPGLTNNQANFGLIANDGRFKPAAKAVQSLIAVLTDTATCPNSKVGMGFETTCKTVQSIVFTKSNGHFYIAIWNEVSSFNVKTQAEIVNALVHVGVKLNMPNMQLAILHDPMLGTSTALVPSGNITTMIPDYPLILEVG